MMTLKPHFSNSLAACSMLVLTFALSGCDQQTDQSPTALVKGVISFQGKPLERGEIVFFPEGGARIAHGKIQPDGSYQLTTYEEGDGALLGNHQITVVSERDMEGVLPEDPEASMEPSLIPTKYSLQKTSGLTAQVKEGDNEINFDLE
ncbi:hypothetical protein [Gimesia panareensis]|uniref:hypothetical protein n=1 Tax=Gimesia panareensis TaxID=2527978 RepID=UPI00118AA482|nr:hypothetical protein [Gimesia panareensis]QDU53160.1 hypothetical protein Pan110_55450 [Gimesia panareensis]